MSAAELVVAAAAGEGTVATGRFSNDVDGHRKLIRFLRRLGNSVRVVLEATGVYGLDAAIALYKAQIEVMVANPRAVANFGKSLLQRSKTDAIDARVLFEFVRRMPFEPWHPPADNRFELRALMRRIRGLKAMIVQEKNRLHACSHSRELTIAIASDIEVNIRHLERRCELLAKKAMTIVAEDSELTPMFQLLLSVRGIGQRSALYLLSELALLPSNITARQLVAHAGLDPRQHESGSSVHKPTRISRAGNKHLRSALFVPATVAVRYDTTVKAFFDRLVARGKHTLQAYVAVMRKLLHAIHAMLRTNTTFDSARFTNAT